MLKTPSSATSEMDVYYFNKCLTKSGKILTLDKCGYGVSDK